MNSPVAYCSPNEGSKDPTIPELVCDACKGVITVEFLVIIKDYNDGLRVAIPGSCSLQI